MVRWFTRKARRGLAAFAALSAASMSTAGLAEDNCAASVQARCLDSLGAGAASLPPPADCRQQLADYRACLNGLVGRAPATGSVSDEAGCDRELTQLLWSEVEEDGNCLSYDAFLAACPKSKLAHLAEARRAKLACGGRTPGPTSASTEAAPSSADRADDASCFRIGARLDRAITVKRGAKLCSAADPSKRIVVTSVQSRGISYRNGGSGSISCLNGEICGVHWSTTLRFRVAVEPERRDVAFLEPVP